MPRCGELQLQRTTCVCIQDHIKEGPKTLRSSFPCFDPPSDTCLYVLVKKQLAPILLHVFILLARVKSLEWLWEMSSNFLFSTAPFCNFQEIIFLFPRLSSDPTHLLFQDKAAFGKVQLSCNMISIQCRINLFAQYAISIK